MPSLGALPVLQHPEMTVAPPSRLHSPISHARRCPFHGLVVLVQPECLPLPILQAGSRCAGISGTSDQLSLRSTEIYELGLLQLVQLHPEHSPRSWQSSTQCTTNRSGLVLPHL